MFQKLIEKGASKQTIIDVMSGKIDENEDKESNNQSEKEVSMENVGTINNNETTQPLEDKESFPRTITNMSTSIAPNQIPPISSSSTSPSLEESSNHQNTAKTKKEEEEDSDDSSSDDESILQVSNKRTRGKKRKHQKEADQKRSLQNEKEKQNLLDKTKKQEEGTKQQQQQDKSKVRRCIGRKPVTDFEVGKQYKGKVVYIKPFGAFIDIMCHSEVFCHVSRVQDDYVEDIHSVLKVDQEVYPRIVEIDRQKRRITVSLQSDARREDEINSSQAKKLRLEKNEKRKQEKAQKQKASRKSNIGSNNYSSESNEYSVEAGWGDDNVEKNASISDHGAGEASGETNNLQVLEAMDESQMTPSQLKQLRKLRRRAERRAQTDVSGVSA